jgi:lipoprotein-releasing system permease protein
LIEKGKFKHLIGLKKNILSLNLEFYISKRLIAAKKYKNSISAPIIKIGIISIALGIIVMLISIATGVGLQKKIKEKISGFNGHIQIVNFDSNQSLVSLVPISNNQTYIDEIKKNPQVHHIQTFAKKAGIIKTDSDFEGVLVKGVSSDYDWSFFKHYLVEGQVPEFGIEVSQDILISKTIAQKLQLKLGEEVVIWFVREELNKPPQIRKFKIKGIYYTGYPEFDNSFVWIDLKHIQKLNKWEDTEVGGFEVFINDFDQIEKVGNEVYKLVPTHMNSTTILEQFPLIFEWIALFDSNIAAIITLMVLIAGFNMITALLVLILEQTRMIGILKALGATNWQIRKIFMVQATYLVMKGLFWGNFIGIGMLLIQQYFGVITLNPETYYVDTAPVYLNPLTILILNLGVVILSYLMLLLPSYYITKITPVKAIRFE